MNIAFPSIILPSPVCMVPNNFDISLLILESIVLTPNILIIYTSDAKYFTYHFN